MNDTSRLTIAALIFIVSACGQTNIEDDPITKEPPQPIDVVEDIKQDTPPKAQTPKTQPPKPTQTNPNTASTLPQNATAPWGPRGGTFDDMFVADDTVYLSNLGYPSDQLWSTTDQETWRALPLLPSKAMAIQHDQGHVYALTQWGNIYQLSSDASQWTELLNDPQRNLVLNVYRNETETFALIQNTTTQSFHIVQWKGDTLTPFADVTQAQHFIGGGFAIVGQKIVAWSGYGPAMVLNEDNAQGDVLTEQHTSIHMTMLPYKGELILVNEVGVWRCNADLTQVTKISTVGATAATITQDTLHVGPTERGYTYSLNLSVANARPVYGARLEPHQSPKALQMVTHQNKPLLLLPNSGPVRVEQHDRGYEIWRSVSPTAQEIQHVAQVGPVTYALNKDGIVFASFDRENWQVKFTRTDSQNRLVRYTKMVSQRDMLYLEQTNGDVHTIAWADGEDARIIATASFEGRLGLFKADGQWLFAAPEARTVLFGGGLYGAPNGATHWTDWSMLHQALPRRQSIHYTGSGDPHVADITTEDNTWWIIGSNIGIRTSNDEGQSWVDHTPPTFKLNTYASTQPTGGKAGSLAQPYRYWIERTSNGVVATDGQTFWRHDGDQWTQKKLDLPSNQRILDLVIHKNHALLATTQTILSVNLSEDLTIKPLVEDWTYGSVFALYPHQNTLLALTLSGIVTLK